MSNTTAPSSALRVLAPFVGYGLTGLPISASNALIVASIVRYEALRGEKEFILLMALALADATNMFNYFIAGIHRSWVYLSDHMDDALTPAQCVTTPYRFIWLFSGHLSCIMLIVVSADRLYLVSRPFSYLSQTASYAWKVVGLVYGFVGGMGVLGLVLALTADQTENPQSSICLSSPTMFGPDESIIRRMYAIYYIKMPSMFALFSVFLYVLVYPVYVARKAKVTPNNLDNNKKKQLKRQRKLTKDLAITCLCTFCLYSLPHHLAHTFVELGLHGVAQMFFILSNANPAANLIVYHLRIPQIRTALVGIFKGKVLPSAIEMWPTNNKPTRVVKAPKYRMRRTGEQEHAF